ncbi:MAG: hypothetical protein KDK45_25585, partial [Leptospiraceae bacterium]|nr:hypothetical protein [Leptospiraceae bacterium]
GNFNVNTKKADQSAKNKIRVKSGNVELNVDDANISLDKSKTADVRFDVKEGKVELSKDGNKQIINQNELLTVKGEKLFMIKKNVKYQNPKNLSVFYTSEETKSIPFNWETNEESKQTYILEIKNTESIKEKDYKIQVNSSNYSVSLKPGKYVWKVYSEDDPNKAFAPAQSFHIIQNSASEIYIPEDKREFTYTRNLPEILFSWKKIDFIDYYKLEVSKDANFSSILRSIKTKNTSTILNNLETGTYYYRLISKLELDGATEKISGLKSFSIKKIFSISPPLLVSPENNYTYYYNEFKFALVLIWKYNSEYSSYRVLVSKDKNFQNIVFQTKTSSESIDIRDELKDGVYYWKVIGSWKEEDKNTDSEIRSIQIQKILPGSIKLTSPVNGSTFNPGNLTF